jgi:hypothetical protein
MRALRYALAVPVVVVVLAVSFEALTLDGAPSSTTAEITHGKACKDHHVG